MKNYKLKYTLNLLAGVAMVTAVSGIGTVAFAADDAVLERMRAEVAEAVGPQTTWDGPTTGPKGLKDKSVVFVSLTQNSSGNADSARGAKEAADVLGWKFTLMDGRGTATGGADALAQAIALQPDGIILGSVSIENNKVQLQAAADAGIVIVGWHATDKPGPVAEPPIFTNVSTDPYEIAYMAGRYAVVHSNGTAGAEVISDRQYPIVVMKTEGIIAAIEECSGCKLLSEDNAPFGEVPQRTPGLISSLLQRFGSDLGYILTFNEVYFDFAVPTLRSAGIEAGSPPFLIAAGDGSESAYQRIRKGQYQIATVPEPAVMHGWQVIDEMNRALSGEEPSGFVTKVHLVTKENVDADGGDRNRFDPSNDYQGHYKSIWGIK